MSSAHETPPFRSGDARQYWTVFKQVAAEDPEWWFTSIGHDRALVESHDHSFIIETATVDRDGEQARFFAIRYERPLAEMDASPPVLITQSETEAREFLSTIHEHLSSDPDRYTLLTEAETRAADEAGIAPPTRYTLPSRALAKLAQHNFERVESVGEDAETPYSYVYPSRTSPTIGGGA